MIFEITGKVTKTLWEGPKSSLYLVAETEKSDFAVFSEHKLYVGSVYKLNGFINKNKSKKYKDDAGKFATDYSFNATAYVKNDEDLDQAFGSDFNGF